MEVEFANRRLQQCYETFARASRDWGDAIARKYIQRVNIIQSVEQFDDLYKLRALRLHRLSGSRAAQFSIVLDRRWRLILTYVEEENKIRIEEVTHHYGVLPPQFACALNDDVFQWHILVHSKVASPQRTGPLSEREVEK